ncbi:exopolysaccharide biosynthesis protein [Roseivivax marinus]|uniref:exopolysaccharide biosynthesis protein n=1 Tax=Roseivivax marinus TaxID=1379903 RepID=UPI001F042FEF|nr:exopolysaccharide biosynthesis protein [Roseivivax marinus]UMA64293.1 exopolysaccharide biosynthesis protein [Roseivivax marinus]
MSDTDGPPVTSLGELLTRIAPAEGEASVSVAEILDKIGDRSFPAAILVPALILVSPVSGIPGTPTIGACIIALIVAQALLGRDHLWLPGLLTRREIGAKRLNQGLSWLRKPAGWVDRHSRDRWTILTYPPFSTVSLLSILVVVMTWPLLELLPFFTSFGAGAVSLFAIGLMIRDGLYIIAGWITVAGVLAVATAIWQGIV